LTTGEPYTVPSANADLWLGHSRGADRLLCAPDHVKTICVDDFQRWNSNEPLEEGGLPPNEHYEITDELIKEILSIKQYLGN